LLELSSFCQRKEKKVASRSRTMMTDSMMHTDVWVMVFRQLTPAELYRVSQVCQSWREYTNQTLAIRKSLECHSKATQVTQAQIDQICSRCPSLTCLRISSCKQITSIEPILSLFHLRELDISRCQQLLPSLQGDGLGRLRKLKVLKMSSVNGPFPIMLRAMIPGSNCHEIEVFSNQLKFY
jgi:hypothetical protein